MTIGVNWEVIGAFMTSVGLFSSVVIGIIKRTQIIDHFTNQAILVARARRAEKRASTLERDFSDAEKSWQFAKDVNSFTRDEANELISRVSKLETYVPKFNAAVIYIKELLKYLNYIEAWFKNNDIASPPQKRPVIPEVLLEDVAGDKT